MNDIRTAGHRRSVMIAIVAVLTALLVPAAHADSRQLVKLPEMMQEHMLSNMRDHLATLNDILHALADKDLDRAAKEAEQRLGMSSLERHGASHMAPFMPKEMQAMGTAMHRAASRFAVTAQEGDLVSTYRALKDVTAACVACHTSYRIR
ncbi:MAG: cytochrome c [Acidiferrobacteraceae bacterium]